MGDRGDHSSTRRQHASESTRASLVDAAERLFVEHGYAATSLDAVAAGADVTKGALYHHFSGKQALFEAAFERVEQRATAAIRDAVEARGEGQDEGQGGDDGRDGDPWLRARAGLRAFLDVAQQPAYRQVVVTDGPAVLGHERFGEQERATTYAVVVEVVGSVLASADREVDAATVDTFARIFFGALSAAGGAVAASDDAGAAAGRAESAIGLVLTGLRGVLEAGGGRQEPGAGGATSRR